MNLHPPSDRDRSAMAAGVRPMEYENLLPAYSLCLLAGYPRQAMQDRLAAGIGQDLVLQGTPVRQCARDRHVAPAFDCDPEPLALHQPHGQASDGGPPRQQAKRRRTEVRRKRWRRHGAPPLHAQRPSTSTDLRAKIGHGD